MRRCFAVAIAAAITCACTSTQPVDSNCKLVEQAEWPVRIESGRLLVDASINGHQVEGILQIGSPKSAVMRNALSRLDIRSDFANGREASGAVRDRFVDYAFIEEIKIGRTSQKKLEAYVVDGKDVGDAAFILGYDFFGHRDFEVDLQNNVIRLFSAQGCTGKSLAYWARGVANEIPIKTRELATSNPSPFIDVQINGQRVAANLNSAGSRSSISGKLVRRLRQEQDNQPLFRTDVAEFDTFTIGGETIHNAKLVLRDMSGEYVMLGLDFFRAHRVLLAHSQGKMYFTYTGGPVFSPQAPAPAMPKPH